MCKVSSKSERVTMGPYKKFVNLAWNDPIVYTGCIEVNRIGMALSKIILSSDKSSIMVKITNLL